MPGWFAIVWLEGTETNIVNQVVWMVTSRNCQSSGLNCHR